MLRRTGALLIGIILSFLPLAAVHAAETETVEFIVRKGDSLWKLGEQYLESPSYWPEIARINNLQDPDRIYPDQKLIVPVYMLRGVPVDGVVTFVKGIAEFREGEEGPWRRLLLHERIGQGSAVRTGTESAVEITYQNEVSLLLREKTEIAVVAAREKSAIHRLFRFFVNVGRAVSTLKRGTGMDDRYEIITPSAVAAARGTHFRVAVNTAETSRMEVLEGRIGARSGKGEVEVPENHGTVIRPHAVPLQPRPLLPPPQPAGLQPLYRSLPLVIAFDQVTGADHSVVTLSRDRQGRDIVREQHLEKDEPLRIMTVEDGSYFVSGRSADTLGLEGKAGRPVEIRVRINPLPPFIQMPPEDAEIKDRSFAIRWLEVSDAVQYHLQISSDPDFQSVVDERHTGETHYTTPDLEYGTYYFRLASLAADGYEGVWSDASRVELIPPPPTPPMEEPEQSESEIVIRWKSLGPDITYHMQMARDEFFGSMVLEQKVDQASASIPRPDKPGTYFVRVRGLDSEGYAGSFSSPQSFEIESRLEKWIAAGGLVIIGLIIAL